MKSSRRDLFIDAVVGFIFKSNQITLFPVLPSHVKQGIVFAVARKKLLAMATIALIHTQVIAYYRKSICLG